MPFIVHLSQPLARRIKAEDLQRRPSAPNPFQDWHASLFDHKDKQYIIAANSATLLCVVFNAAMVTASNIFFQGLLNGIEYQLRLHHISRIYKKKVALNINGFLYAQMHDRRTIKALNEQITFAKKCLNLADMPGEELSFYINMATISCLDDLVPLFAIKALEKNGK